MRALPGIFRIAGSPPTWEQQVKAALLWAGPDSYLSHRSAAALWGFKGFNRGVVEISVGGKGSKASGVVVHRVEGPQPGIVFHRGFRVSNPARTIMDLCGVAERPVVEDALDDCLRRRMLDLGRLGWLLDLRGSKGRSGIGLFRELVQERKKGITHSELERWMCRLLRRARMRLPDRQLKIFDDNGDFVAQVDLAYRDARLIIELDGYGPHSQKPVFEKDRRRRNTLTNLGWRILHFTWERLRDDPDGVIAEIRRALGSSGPRR